MRHWLTLLVLGLAAEALAQPGEIQLDAPAGCPDRAALVSLVEEHAGGAFSGSIPARVTARRHGGRWTAAVALPGSPVRTFDGATCAEVIDAAALVIALADPGDTPDPDPDLDPVPDPDPDPDPDPVPAVAVGHAAPPAPQRIDLDVRAGALADAGSLPSPSVAASGSVAASLDAHRLELSFAIFHGRSASVSDPGVEVVPVGLWTAGLRGCRRISFATLCLGGEAGRMTAAGAGLADGRDRGALWSALSASGWIRRSIGGRAGVYAGIEAVGAIARPRFFLEDGTPLHRPAAAARALVGLELDVR